MEKIILKDGTELDIENGATERGIAVVTEDLTIIDTYVKVLTDENLSSAVVVDKKGVEIVNLSGKSLSLFDGTRVVGSTKYIVCFRFVNAHTVEDRIAVLEAENEALKESQEIQDEAIVELAGIIAE